MPKKPERVPTGHEVEMSKTLIGALHCFATNEDVALVAGLVARMRDSAYEQGRKDGVSARSRRET